MSGCLSIYVLQSVNKWLHGNYNFYGYRVQNMRYAFWYLSIYWNEYIDNHCVYYLYDIFCINIHKTCIKAYAYLSVKSIVLIYFVLIKCSKKWVTLMFKVLLCLRNLQKLTRNCFRQIIALAYVLFPQNSYDFFPVKKKSI